jgi:hypothetical protein
VVALTYSHGTGLAVGTTGAQNVSALTAGLAYQATRELRFSAMGGWTRTWSLDGGPDEETTNAYGAGVSASYQLTRWLALTLSYRFSLEDEEGGDSIQTNQVILGLTAAPDPLLIAPTQLVALPLQTPVVLITWRPEGSGRTMGSGLVHR